MYNCREFDLGTYTHEVRSCNVKCLCIQCYVDVIIIRGPKLWAPKIKREHKIRNECEFKPERETEREKERDIENHINLPTTLKQRLDAVAVLPPVAAAKQSKFM